MSISILNRGASGGLKPELIITAPAGSTISLLQDSKTIDTYTLGENETTHLFKVKFGNYTVTGTSGSYTNSSEIIVDFAKQYNIVISLNRVVNGDFLNDLEGWSYGGTGSNATYQRRGTEVIGGVTYGYVNVDLNQTSYMTQEVDFTGASKLSFVGCVNNGNAASSPYGYLLIDDTIIYSELYGTSSIAYHEFDVSSYTGVHTIMFKCSKTDGAGNSTKFIFTNVTVH